LGQGLLIVDALRSHSDTPHSVEFLWPNDQPDAENYAWQHTHTHTHTHTWDIYPYPQRDSNPQSQQANWRIATPWLSRLLWSAGTPYTLITMVIKFRHILLAEYGTSILLINF